MALKKAQINNFKAQLEILRDQMNQNIRTSSEDVKTPDDSKGYSQHQADEGTDDFQRTIGIEVSGKELYILRQVERALEKIDEGTYGVCDVTGDEIPIKRLEAIPYATMTVSAQEKHEKEQA